MSWFQRDATGKTVSIDGEESVPLSLRSRHGEYPLADFVRARVTEDHALAASTISVRDETPGFTFAARLVAQLPEPALSHVLRWGPQSVLRECEAKLRIVARSRWVERHPDWRNDMEMAGAWEDAYSILCDLALPYADHPDYREEWRP